MNKPDMLSCLAGLFFCMAFYAPGALAQHKSSVPVINTMTVIKILPEKKGDTVTRVIFQTSQRIYKISIHCNHIYMRRLKESNRKHSPVIITRASEQSDLILDVKKAKRK